MDDELLKQRVRDLVERIPRMTREDAREAIYGLVKEYQLAETKDGVIHLSDLSRIQDLAVSQSQDISLPFTVDGREATEQQKRAYIFLVASVMFLRGAGLMKRNIQADLGKPILEPVDD